MNNLNKFLGQKKGLVVSILIILLLCSAGGMLSIYLRYHSLAHLRQSKKTSVNRTLYDIVLGDNNPFRKYANMSPEDLKAIPKYDRPDLAALHDFTMTQDPSLGYPPVERKIQAFQSNWWIPPLFLDIIPGVQWLKRA